MKSINYKKEYGRIIAKILDEFFYLNIYLPLLKAINEDNHNLVKLSAEDIPDLYLMKKIQSGVILYDGAYFTGKFDSRSSIQIKELGGQWDNAKKAFKLSPGKLTPNLKTAISSSKDRLKRINDGLNNTLGKIGDEIGPSIEELDLDNGLDKVLAGLESQAKNAMKSIGVKYKLTVSQQDTIKKEYTNNMKVYIKDWADEHISNLRKDVENNSMAGYRFDRLVKTLQLRYGSSKSKAEFLAQQETSLFMAKFRQQRFLDAGVNFYTWQTVGDNKVRSDHRALDNRIFQFGNPPVVDVATGRKGEPGEDFRCRCIARPLTKPVHKVGGEWKVID